MSDQPPSPQPGAAPPATSGGYAPPPRDERAGFGSRFLGAVVDGILLGVLGFIIGKAFGQDPFTVTKGVVKYHLNGAAFLVTQAVNVAYFVYLEGSSGQTLGKRMAGVRVVSLESGAPIGYGSAFVRWIGRVVSALPCLLGYFWMLWDKQRQTWHDKFANAIVVRTN